MPSRNICTSAHVTGPQTSEDRFIQRKIAYSVKQMSAQNHENGAFARSMGETFKGRRVAMVTFKLFLIICNLQLVSGFMVERSCRAVYRSRGFVGKRTPVETEISMGLRDGFRSFIGKKKDEPEPFSSKPKAAPAATPVVKKEVKSAVKPFTVPTPAPSPEQPLTPKEAPVKKPVRMGEDPKTKEVNVHTLDHPESVQERINRVKSGQMTPEEKEAFLKTALTAGSTIETRKPLRPPTGRDLIDPKKGYAAPFPTDSILRNFASGNKRVTPKDDPKFDSNKRKKDYLDMVTNPERFGRYKTYASGSQSGGLSRSQPIAPVANSKTPISDISKVDWRKDIRNPTIQPKYTNGVLTPNVPTVPGQAPMPDDLGARLGAAAMASENNRQRAELERRELERKRAEEKREQERKAAEMARQRQDELAIREAEMREKRRQQEEAALRAERDKKRMEEERLKEMIRKQEEYWQKRLAVERQQKAASLPSLRDEVLGKEDFEPVAEEPEPESELEPAGSTSEEYEEEYSEPMQPAKVFNPDESDLLVKAKQDREEDWEDGQYIIERSASTFSEGPRTVDPIQSEQDFLAEQARKKMNIDRTREEQLKRLKELNSPLPSPPPRSRVPAAPPIIQTSRGVVNGAATSWGPKSPPVKFEPQIAASSSSTASSRLRGDLFQNSKAQQRSVKADDDDPVDLQASLAELKRKVREEEGSGPLNGSRVDRPVTPARNLWSAPVSNQSRNQTPRNNSPNTSPPPPQRKGPIRMSLPMSDSNSEEEDGVDPRKNKQMSIAEAMKRTNNKSLNQEDRSKKWGIDMSKFQD